MPLSIDQKLDSIRHAAEQSLFYYCRVVLGYRWLSASLHRDMSAFLQSADKPRKLMLVPRDHVKTTLVKAQCTHAFIQPASSNIYFPNIAGVDTRIIIAGETTRNAARHLRSIEATLDKNALHRALWPSVRAGSKNSEHELELVRTVNYSEPSIEALGTDSAIASRHVDWIFCDDIYTFEAMQSPSVSERISLWFSALEPILDETENSSAKLTVTGTPWAERDVYKQILDSITAGEEDYQVYHRSVIENGLPIWPERFPLERLERIERRASAQGLWHLNWMCTYGESEFSDFRSAWLQNFALEDSEIVRSDGSRIKLSACDIVAVYDPARTRESEYRSLARNALMVTACDASYNVYVLAYYAARTSLRNIYDKLVEFTSLCHPRCLGVEDVATQIAIGDAFVLISKLDGSTIPPLVSLRPDTSTNKKWRIKTEFQRVASYNRFYIQSHHYEFKSEWSAFPNGRTIDLLDVGAYAISLHNIPDNLSAQDYNVKKRQDMSNNIIDIESEREQRYQVRRPPEGAPALMRIG